MLLSPLLASACHMVRTEQKWTQIGISIHSSEHASPGLTLPLLHQVIGGSLFLILQPSTVSIPIGADCGGLSTLHTLHFNHLDHIKPL